MKTFTPAQSPTDGAAAKPQIIAGILSRYRALALQYRDKQDRLTTSRPVARELVERPKVSLRAQDRQNDLIEFSRYYEWFVESICDGAQLGISPSIESRYQQSRFELVNRYVSLRVFLCAYLRQSGEDCRGAAQGIRFDAFDALLGPVSLEDFLQSDDGHTISRITRTREALNLYGEHLKQLIERTR